MYSYEIYVDRYFIESLTDQMHFRSLSDGTTLGSDVHHSAG